MIKISSSIEYAARIMVYLAGHPNDEPVRADKIAGSENIPRDYVDQLLLRLRRSGLIASRRGARGGYALARAPRDISIGSVIRAVDEGVFEAVCGRYAEGEHQCTHTTGCGIRPVWYKLEEMVGSFLDSVSLDELCAPESCVESRVSELFRADSLHGKTR